MNAPRLCWIQVEKVVGLAGVGVVVAAADYPSASAFFPGLDNMVYGGRTTGLCVAPLFIFEHVEGICLRRDRRLRADKLRHCIDPILLFHRKCAGKIHEKLGLNQSSKAQFSGLKMLIFSNLYFKSWESKECPPDTLQLRF